MSILVDRRTRVVVQGLTGREGAFHAGLMKEYGTAVAAGVTPGKGGTTHLGIPVFNTVEEAVRREAVDASVIFVPPLAAADAILEAAEAGLSVVVCITEGIPTQDMIRVKACLCGSGTTLIGPNTPGIITPGETKLGILPASVHQPGRVGVMSRSGTLTYEAVHQLSGLGLGQSTAVGIGGDPIVGLSFRDLLGRFQTDSGTDGVVIIGEIGGTAEEDAAAFIAAGGFTKPAVAYIAGRTAPAGRRMGHAGAIMSGGRGTAAQKVDALEAAGVRVVLSPAEIGLEMKRALEERA